MALQGRSRRAHDTARRTKTLGALTGVGKMRSRYVTTVDRAAVLSPESTCPNLLFPQAKLPSGIRAQDKTQKRAMVALSGPGSLCRKESRRTVLFFNGYQSPCFRRTQSLLGILCVLRVLPQVPLSPPAPYPSLLARFSHPSHVLP